MPICSVKRADPTYFWYIILSQLTPSVLPPENIVFNLDQSEISAGPIFWKGKGILQIVCKSRQHLDGTR